MRSLLIVLAVAVTAVRAAPGQTDPPIAELLEIHQSDLAADGKALLEKEARAASFFVVGGLHGDKETPALVGSLWPTVGYQYLAAEMSPWAARPLNSFRSHAAWGLSETARREAFRCANRFRTLEVEVERANRQGNDGLAASIRREAVMKEFFLAHYRAAGGKPKVMAVFGQNHPAPIDAAIRVSSTGPMPTRRSCVTARSLRPIGDASTNVPPAPHGHRKSILM